MRLVVGLSDDRNGDAGLEDLLTTLTVELKGVRVRSLKMHRNCVEPMAAKAFARWITAAGPRGPRGNRGGGGGSGSSGGGGGGDGCGGGGGDGGGGDGCGCC